MGLIYRTTSLHLMSESTKIKQEHPERKQGQSGSNAARQHDAEIKEKRREDKDKIR